MASFIVKSTHEFQSPFGTNIRCQVLRYVSAPLPASDDPRLFDLRIRFIVDETFQRQYVRMVYLTPNIEFPSESLQFVAQSFVIIAPSSLALTTRPPMRAERLPSRTSALTATNL